MPGLTMVRSRWHGPLVGDVGSQLPSVMHLRRESAGQEVCWQFPSYWYLPVGESGQLLASTFGKDP